MDDPQQLPAVFPLLPHIPGGWSVNVINAHRILDDAFNRALIVLRQEDSDPLRLRMVSENLVNEMAPILEGMKAMGSLENTSSNVCMHSAPWSMSYTLPHYRLKECELLNTELFIKHKITRDTENGMI